jgi:hypothetical protein
MGSVSGPARDIMSANCKYRLRMGAQGLSITNKQALM